MHQTTRHREVNSPQLPRQARQGNWLSAVATLLLTFALLPSCSSYGASLSDRAASPPGAHQGNLDGIPAAGFLFANEGASAGSFFQDGSDGDVRARTENSFSPAPDARETDAPPAAKPSRLRIYRADIALAVASVDTAVAAARRMAEATGGYLVSSSINELTVRVPAKDFDSFVESVCAEGSVIQRSVDVQDVTDQHRDLTLRLDNAKRSRDRLVALLEAASTVKDILAIEKELQRLTTEIESVTGFLRSLNETIAFSTITLRYLPANAARDDRNAEPSASDFDWIRQIGAAEVLRWF